MGCAMVLGSNIGTTVTPFLASLSGNVAAKKAALGHFMFNVFGTVWCMCVFFPFVNLNEWITESLGQGNPTELMGYATELQASDPALYNRVIAGEEAHGNPLAERLIMLQFAVSFGLSMFHMVFNLINLSIMLWFTKVYVKIANLFIHSKHNEDEEIQLTFISCGIMKSGSLNITRSQPRPAV